MQLRPSEALNLHREAIRRIVAAHRASNPRVFGSVLKGEDDSDSDLDLLVDPVGASLFDLAAITIELEDMMGIRVDVLTPKSLPARFRDRVLLEAQPV
ncbi:MAG: nucleotidyltransferase family protein [Burkholderiales bacterium]|jgi:predicted nucleotidyltransferase